MYNTGNSRSAPGPCGKSSPALPVRPRHTASDLQSTTGHSPCSLGPSVPEAFLLILTPHPHPQPHRPPSPRIVSYPVHGACSSVPDVYSSTAPATKFLFSSCRLCLRPRRFGLRSDPNPYPHPHPHSPPKRPEANVALADLPGRYCEEPVDQQRPGAPPACQASNLTRRNFSRHGTAGGCPVGFTF